MSRSLQDQFIDDDEEETCPLCVEEFDLTDKGFRPCPCGYQICQFCYHNVKNNMNGLCPACRRPYRDEDIDPTTQEDLLLQTLRGDQYFGQYGKIIKIVVSKAKDPTHPHSVGVYVTYERKEDAAACIAAVDGSKNGDRTLRAQFGTTKYCSAYLRGENCTNRNCMFLHEPGEANESYSRADLSVLNAGSSQTGSGRPPPPQSQQPMASAAQPMLRQGSNDQGESSERPALPSTASWASKPPHQSRAESRSTSTTLESPVPVPSEPAPAPTQPEPQPEAEPTPAPAPAAEEPQAEATTEQPVVTQPKRSQVSPLTHLLRNLKLEDFRLVWSNSCLSQADQDVIKNYPPLFDLVDGPKRRLRKQQEAEEKIRKAQEAQSFQQPPEAEPEDNPEMSGSLQLGGEPEERQSERQVQSAIHPPGQEGALDQRFQYPGAVSSPGISDRGLTPQQHQQMLLQTLKPNAYGSSSAFNSTFPQQTNQQPLGHQRNVSRYSFANDSSSASSAVKPVANPKLMNQQSSMMPPTSGNHFGTQHQQPHGQFYTSNVQGPPPGLKTTGTPPVSGNLTFGQGHGFATGGLQYGAGSARSQQDTYYRDLMRGRDGTAAGVDPKRELLSHPNNYSSHNATYAAGQVNAFPNPPYAQLGAFGDGEKQRKKKGKKHRHANTSSSSGGGLADVSDAGAHNLLQARLHQGSAGFGGNAFAGQAAGVAEDSEFPPLRSRQTSIAISQDESRRSTPPIPPGFEAQLANESRRSTPSIPPGLSKPTALPDLEGSSSRPSSRPSSRASLRRQTSQVFPVVPLPRPGTPARIASSSRLEKHDKENAVPETPTKPSRKSPTSELKVAGSASHEEAQKENNDTKATTTEADKAAVPKPLETKEPERQSKETKTPTLTEAQEPDKSVSAKSVKAKQSKQAQTDSSHAAVETSDKSEVGQLDTQKRKHPGKLDITAATNKINKIEQAVGAPSATADSNTPNKPQRSFSTVSQTSASAKPLDSPSVSSPAIKTTAPRTLRVVQTPKAETPPPVAPPAIPAVVGHRLPSRQPSVASINPPGTPSSEQISMSDNISMTSTSVSRANSPPPAASKVGSAPVRAKTKNQQKKERQERAKALEEEKAKQDEAVKPSSNEPVVEAIVSRKKKEKKAKDVKPPKAKAAATATADTTPTTSRPVSPSGKAAIEAPVKAESPVPIPKEAKPATPVKTTPPPAPQAANPSPPPTPTLDPAQLLREIKASVPQMQKCIDSLFRVSSSQLNKTQQHNVSQKDLLSHFKADFKYTPTKEEVEALLKGSIPAIHYGGEDGRTFDRGMITPAGAHLRALTQEIEQRFLELEKAIRETPEELRFKSSKPQNETKFETLDLEALRRTFENGAQRGASVMEQMVQDGSPMKKGAFLVDEASKYINEFVMPPVTPPPQRQSQQHRGAEKEHQHGSHANAAVQSGTNMSLEHLERQIGEAKRANEERENSLKKVIKKNKKLLGVS
ncbi:putative general negative regulator of transcription C16C9.04c [Pseudocercospora fuligena]|uniref:Putative general negative regulator of transcription C16C9.04c n=1 Tax=Pseudocercospora fuligena TaxID=685502 RepID=A0A8H6RIL3_9PEZI|nr:putative general negative regulator of transcription C16C9.04c [Pseudocercospora fuligena]